MVVRIHIHPQNKNVLEVTAFIEQKTRKQVLISERNVAVLYIQGGNDGDILMMAKEGIVLVKE